MKGVLISLVMFVSVSIGSAQWTQINTSSADDYIHVSFVNDSTGVLASGRVLMLSENYGDTWDTIYYNSDDVISDVQFLNDNTIYFIGYSTSNALFLKKSFDLGNNWSTIDLPEGGYEKMFFTSPDAGHLLAQNIMSNTFDGGDTWTNGTFSHTLGFLVGDLFFTSSSTGYFVGYYNSVNYKTIDSGASWNLTPNTGGGLDIYFPSLEVGYTCGHDGGALKTIDAGANWTSLNTGITDFRDLHSIFCLSNNNCYTVGDDGTILKTTDGGENWLPETSGTTENLRSVYCTSKYCYAVGDNGVVLRTANTLNSTNENNKKENVKTYPNPVNEEIIIEIETGTNIQSIQLLDINGKTVKNYSSKMPIINISELPNGHYVVKITTDKGTFTEKIIKQ
ncbi:MAG: T9SS type A sorting domain-containing protein [Bacteroidia bacterium]